MASRQRETAAKGAERPSQDRSKAPQDNPKTPPGRPKTPQDGPKTPPRRSQDAKMSPRHNRNQAAPRPPKEPKSMISGRFWMDFSMIFEPFLRHVLCFCWHPIGMNLLVFSSILIFLFIPFGKIWWALFSFCFFMPV